MFQLVLLCRPKPRYLWNLNVKVNLVPAYKLIESMHVFSPT